MLDLNQFIGFDWDQGNKDKNCLKHKVTNHECEEIFFNQPLLVIPDPKHSQIEARYYALGKTNHNRLLFISFTARKRLIRVISVRSISKREKLSYEKFEKNS